MPEQQHIGRKQLTGLFLCSLFTMMYAGPLLRLLPVYARQMGVASSLVGVYLSLVYAGLVVGTLAAGWLSDKFQRRKTTMIVCSLMASGSIALMARSGNFWQLALSTTSSWLFGGITFTLITILAGIYAGEDERGKVYGLLIVSMPLANVLAAPVAGRVADRWGYPALFSAYSAFMLLIPLTALFLEDRRVVAHDAHVSPGDQPSIQGRRFGRNFYFLVIATFVMAFVGFVNQLGLSLSMYAQSYSSSNLATAVAIGAFIAIPLVPLFGWLSDRVSRVRILIVCYLSAAAGSVVLAVADTLWQFWLASILLALLTATNSVGNALTADLVPRESVGRGLSLTNSARWVGAVVGFAVAGIAIDVLGTHTVFLLIALLVPFSIVLAAQIRTEDGTAPTQIGQGA